MGIGSRIPHYFSISQLRARFKMYLDWRAFTNIPDVLKVFIPTKLNHIYVLHLFIMPVNATRRLSCVRNTLTTFA